MSERYIQFKTRDEAVIEKAKRTALAGATEVFEVSAGQFRQIRVQKVVVAPMIDGWQDVTVAGVDVGPAFTREQFIRRYLPVQVKERDYSDDSQWDLLDQGWRLKKRQPEDVQYVTSDHWEYDEALSSLTAGRATTLGDTYGFVVSVSAWHPASAGVPAHGTIILRPSHDAESLKVLGIRQLGNITLPINYIKEQNMKVFEAIVIETDDKGEPTKVLKVVAPFVAKDAATANNIVRVDYAQEHSLAGKEASALVVRVREFSGI